MQTQSNTLKTNLKASVGNTAARARRRLTPPPDKWVRGVDVRKRCGRLRFASSQSGAFPNNSKTSRSAVIPPAFTRKSALAMESPLFTHSKPNDLSQVGPLQMWNGICPGVPSRAHFSTRFEQFPKKRRGVRVGGGVSGPSRSQVMSVRIEPGSSTALMAPGRRRLDGGENQEALLSTYKAANFIMFYLPDSGKCQWQRVSDCTPEPPRGLEATTRQANGAGVDTSKFFSTRGRWDNVFVETFAIAAAQRTWLRAFVSSAADSVIASAA